MKAPFKKIGLIKDNTKSLLDLNLNIVNHHKFEDEDEVEHSGKPRVQVEGIKEQSSSGKSSK